MTILYVLNLPAYQFFFSCKYVYNVLVEKTGVWLTPLFIFVLCLFYVLFLYAVFSSIRKRRKRLKCNENISNMFACGSRAFFISGGEGWGVIPRFNVISGYSSHQWYYFVLFFPRTLSRSNSSENKQHSSAAFTFIVCSINALPFVISLREDFNKDPQTKHGIISIVKSMHVTELELVIWFFL